MSTNRKSTLLFKEIMQNLKTEDGAMELEGLEIKKSPKVITREEKIQEASKPLYLKRYE